MAQYIDKSALVAEIERRQKIHFNDYHINRNGSPADYGACNALTQILAFIDTLEVKEVEDTTASDRGMAEEIIINLKRVEQDYHIDLTKEMEWLRNQVKKGEEV